MRTRDDIARLDAAATSWVGTPFCPNSAVKGAGVCCHRLIGAIYEEAGWLPKLDLPDGSPAHAKFSRRPVMLEWLKGPGQQWFLQRADTRQTIGDLLLVRYGHVSHHLALALSGGRVVHVCVRLGVQIVQALPARWQERVEGAFFPVEVSHG